MTDTKNNKEKLAPIDPTVDSVFKTLLGTEENKPLLINFLNSILRLKQEERVERVNLINPYNPKAHLTDKYGIVDVKAFDYLGRTFQVEVQTTISVGLENRMMYSWANICGSALKSGEIYEELKPTISIWLLTRNLFSTEDTKAVHLRFGWYCREHKKTLCEGNRIHVVQLKNFEKNGKIEDDQASWVRFFKEAKEIDLNHLPEWVTDSPILRKAVNVLSTISRDRVEYLYYEDRKKIRRDTVGVLNALKVSREQTAAEAKRADTEAKRAEAAQGQVQVEAKRADTEAKRAEAAQERAEAALAENARLRQLLAGSTE